jgi:AmpD protein
LKRKTGRGGRRARDADRRPKIDARGLASGARFIPSPNCDDRPPGEAVRLIVIHNISLPPGEFGGDDIARLFCNTLDCSAHPYYDGLRDLRVSAHFLVRRWGEIVQFVQCTRRAWHAGESTWRGRTCCNDFSIGIELEGADAVPYADAQYAALAALTAALMRAYPVEEVLGHADIAPGRKTDPGSAFDWPRFRTLLSRAA